MNELIAKLYDRAIVLEDRGDYVSGELDPAKFAELIIKECATMLREIDWAYDLPKDEYSENAVAVMAAKYIEEQFGVKQ